MNTERIDPIVNALLFEGYLLYPYRRSALKNRYRWTFGCVAPRDYSLAHAGAEAWTMLTECLLRGSPATTLGVQVRFLHLCGAGFEPEAVQRVINPAHQRLGDLTAAPKTLAFAFQSEGPESRALEGAIELWVEEVQENLFKLRVRILNPTPLADALETTREEALRQSLASTHTILHLNDGAFISLQDPPEQLQDLAGACRNQGMWPALVGEPGQTDFMLCAPIILADYPRLAPESPGDFFDATEIDELLMLRIQTLTDQEKLELTRADERSRSMLHRVESLECERRLRLHGAVRERSGIAFKPGDRVRLRPRRRADAFDLLLDGKLATVVAIEQDLENRTFLAVTVDDDPGCDLGAQGKPGHRFFFGVDEVEPLATTEGAPP